MKSKEKIMIKLTNIIIKKNLISKINININKIIFIKNRNLIINITKNNKIIINKILIKIKINKAINNITIIFPHFMRNILMKATINNNIKDLR